MKAPSLTVAAIIALTGALMSCGDSEEVAPVPTATFAPATPSASTTPTAVHPSPTVPADWVTFHNPDAFRQASFRYPPDWHAQLEGVSSSDPAGWPSVCRPSGEMGIQASALPVEEIPRPKGATDFALGSYIGWELVEEVSEDCTGRAHTVAIERNGLLYTLIFISDSAGDEPVFQRILTSLQLPPKE